MAVSVGRGVGVAYFGLSVESGVGEGPSGMVAVGASVGNGVAVSMISGVAVSAGRGAAVGPSTIVSVTATEMGSVAVAARSVSVGATFTDTCVALLGVALAILATA